MTHAERIHLTAALEAKRLDLAAQLSARIREITVVERALRAIDEEVEAGHDDGDAPDFGEPQAA